MMACLEGLGCICLIGIVAIGCRFHDLTLDSSGRVFSHVDVLESDSC